MPQIWSCFICADKEPNAKYTAKHNLLIHIRKKHQISEENIQKYAQRIKLPSPKQRKCSITATQHWALTALEASDYLEKNRFVLLKNFIAKDMVKKLKEEVLNEESIKIAKEEEKKREKKCKSLDNKIQAIAKRVKRIQSQSNPKMKQRVNKLTLEHMQLTFQMDAFVRESLWRYTNISGNQEQISIPTECFTKKESAAALVSKLDKFVELLIKQKKMVINSTVSYLTRSTKGTNQFQHSDSAQGDELHMLLIVSDFYNPPMFYNSLLPGKPITGRIPLKQSGQVFDEFRQRFSERFGYLNNIEDSLKNFTPISEDQLNMGDLIVFYSDTPHFGTYGGRESEPRSSLFLTYHGLNKPPHCSDSQLNPALYGGYMYAEDEEAYFKYIYSQEDRSIQPALSTFLDKNLLCKYEKYIKDNGLTPFD
ncbi:hypothetical protein BC833DRAFT_653197 [Globomyces pollinis-pini]|nr:hypothetical protein BC833DRAFT_653197 [Globomyces pollinis-pini]